MLVQTVFIHFCCYECHHHSHFINGNAPNPLFSLEQLPITMHWRVTPSQLSPVQPTMAYEQSTTGYTPQLQCIIVSVMSRCLCLKCTIQCVPYAVVFHFKLLHDIQQSGLFLAAIKDSTQIRNLTSMWQDLLVLIYTFHVYPIRPIADLNCVPFIVVVTFVTRNIFWYRLNWLAIHAVCLAAKTNRR